MKLSHRARNVQLSTTLAVDAKVQRLRAQGEKLWSFGAGQPNFPTPPAVAEAGVVAIHQGKTVYTSTEGTPLVRQAICQKLHRENGLTYTPDEILVSNGAKQAIYMALAVLLDPGDEVLIPAPYWVSYPEMVKLLGGVPKILPTDESSGFRVTPDQLRAAVTPRTVGLLLNSPSNPTGTVYSREELQALEPVILESGLRLITDEIYERILYDGAVHVSPASLSPALRERTALINGVSKAFSMTGWRIGYRAAPKEWIEPAVAMQSHLSGNACSISQEATAAALLGSDASVQEMVQAFARRRTRVLALLTEAPGLKTAVPQGAFYVFPDFSAYYGKSAGGRTIHGSQEMANYLIDEARVALVPGDAFGSDRHLRISYAVADSVIEEGLPSMLRALGRLG
jgi:aspartate aminotransferase